MYFWTYRLPKVRLRKCLISALSEDPSNSHMVNGLKHCWNLTGSTFTIFIDNCEGNSVAENLPAWYAKYSDDLLTNGLLMRSILFLIQTIYCNIFRYNYLRNKRFFSFLHFRNLQSILNFFKKKWSWSLMYFWTSGLRKTWLDKCLKGPVSDDPSTSNMVNGLKHSWNLYSRVFQPIIMPAHLRYLWITLQAIQLGKVSRRDMQNLGTVCSNIDCRWQVFSS